MKLLSLHTKHSLILYDPLYDLSHLHLIINIYIFNYTQIIKFNPKNDFSESKLLVFMDLCQYLKPTVCFMKTNMSITLNYKHVMNNVSWRYN